MDKEFWHEKLKSVPQRPGVYLFRDSAGEIIYVGKAENLKNRVSSYFRPERGMAPKTLAMRERAAAVETIVVDSPAEALLLECNLIKLHRPHYNIMLKDDKTYPYVKLTRGEEFPRLLVTRQLRDDGGRYFGPFTDVGAMNETVALTRRLFPLRTCNAKPGRSKGRACLNYDLGNCTGPCHGHITAADYAALVEGAERFLAGDVGAIREQLQRQMLASSEALDFETAAACRDKLRAIATTMEKQKISSPGQQEDRDFAAISRDGELACATVFFFRGGKLLGRESVMMERCAGLETAELYRMFLLSFYRGDRLIPPEIVVSEQPNDGELLRGMLREKRGGRFSFTVPQRGEKLRLLSLAAQNGELLLGEESRSKHGGHSEAAQALQELRLALGLESTPFRIECYDISHVQGAYTVGSMIVFHEGLPAPREYRKFKIKTVQGVDDFASLAEVLERRLKRAQSERAAGKSEGFAHLPDLVIIDGGKGQLSAVLPVRDRYAPEIPFVSLAKRQEELILPHEPDPLCLPVGSPAYHLIERIRDEAHRFAITFHRQLRGKGQTRSVLDQIPGIGEKRRRALLKHFGAVAKIEKATVDELTLVPTMTRESAENVYNFFRLKNN